MSPTRNSESSYALRRLRRQKPKQAHRQARLQAAFTLIELLVVVSIISLLVSILLPALGRARLQAKNVVCMSNTRQMGLAVTMYLMENADRLPSSSCCSSDPEDYWLRVLTNYTKEKLLMRCPADKSNNFIDWDVEPLEIAEDARWSSFACNALLDVHDAMYSGKYNRVTNIKQPRYCIYVCESPQEWTSADHLHPETWGSLDNVKSQVDYNRHIDAANYLFLDAHVGNLKIEETWDYPTINYWLPESAPSWPGWAKQ